MALIPDIPPAISHIIGSIIPSSALDVVGVYNQNYVQVFSEARPLKAVVKEASKVMEQPLETGATIVYHSIILPIEIELSLILNSAGYLNVYQQIKQLYLSRELLIVQTKTGEYINQVIQSMPHEEDPDRFDAVIVALKLKETLFAITQIQTVPIAPRNPTDNNTVQRGGVNGMPATRPQTGLSEAIFGRKTTT